MAWSDTVASEYASRGQTMTQADKDYWNTNQNLGALQGAFAANTPSAPAAKPSSGTGGNIKAITDAYKGTGGYAAEKAGVDWWDNYAATSGDANWLDKLTGSLKADAGKASTTGLKGAQNLLGFKGDVWDNAALSQEDKTKLILDSYKNYGFMAPDEKGFGNFMSNFDSGFGDYSFANDWDNVFLDLEGRKNSMDLRGEQDVYGYAQEAQGTLEAALAKLMAQMGGGAGGGAGGGGINDYLNPYLNSVLGGAIGDLSDTATMNRNRLGTSAFSAGAYGDGRHGVESGALTQDLMKNVGDLSNSVRAQGYESAMGWKNTDIDRQMSAAFQNAGLESTWFNNNLNAASTGSNIANGSAGLGFQFADMLTGLDGYDRDWLQQQLNADYEDFWGGQNWDSNQLAQFASIIGGVPGQSGSSTSTPSNMWASILGSLSSDPNLFGNLAKTTSPSQSKNLGK